MKKKTVRMIGLGLMLLCFTGLLTACGDKTTDKETTPTQSVTEAPAETEYAVSVKDASGNPYTEGVVVKFLQNGTQAGMQVVDANGVAKKTLPTGEYSVELVFTDEEESGHYEKDNLVLTADNARIEIVLSNVVSGETTSVFVPSEANQGSYVERKVYTLCLGSTYVTLVPNEINYFLYSPAEAGMYRFSSSEEEAAIGYYGAPHYVLKANAATTVDNSFELSMSASMIGSAETGGTVLVIGITPGTAEDCVITIARTGNAEHTIADEPWEIYKVTTEPEKYVLPEGTKLVDFDITAATDTYTLVYNSTDGFYHMNSENGPLVYMRLGQDSQYMSCFDTILQATGVSKYYYDEDGNFVKRVSFVSALKSYIECMDTDSGVYPLTEDLKYILLEHGGYVGWWNASDPGFMFEDENEVPLAGFNADIAWLFMCCYAAN